MAAPHAGDPAPEFSLLAQDGSRVTLSALRGRAVVLIFYPMDKTPGCTAQLCAARDDADRYKAAGVDVFGVNNGSAASHESFVTKHGLRTPLLVDTGLDVSTAYGAVLGLGKLSMINRTVVGIAPDGTISYYQRGSPSTDAILAAVAPG